jgi:nitrite reductase/ring-hydroxylating ferredoxin subunit
MLMTLHSFVEVATQDCPATGKASVVHVDGLSIALFNLNGRLYALSDFCIRCGGSLASGVVVDTQVGCRQCSWRYDIVSGRLVELPALAIDRFEVKVNDGQVLIATEPCAIGAR